MRISEVARKWGEGGPEVARTEQARRPHLLVSHGEMDG